MSHSTHSPLHPADVQPETVETHLRKDSATEPRGRSYQRPASGRTTALGRRVEKPGNGKQVGPSGQRDEGLCDAKHANK